MALVVLITQGQGRYGSCKSATWESDDNKEFVLGDGKIVRFTEKKTQKNVIVVVGESSLYIEKDPVS